MTNPWHTFGPQVRTRNKEFHEYLGIQYASITRRFEYSVPVNFDGDLFNIPRYEGPNCLEDRLYLNIYTPRKNVEKFPVMVFVPSDIFPGFDHKFDLTSFCGPDFIVEENIVLVILSYRMGNLGFVKINADVGAPGEVGFYDIILGLEWVRKSIKFFNGDAKNVTVCAQGLGAGFLYKILCLPLYEKKSLPFQKVILQSCMVHCLDDYFIKGSELAKQIGQCFEENEEKIAEYLREQPLATLLHQHPLNVYKAGFDRVLTTKKLEKIAEMTARIAKKVKVMIGYNNGEGIIEKIIQKTKYKFIYHNHDFLIEHGSEIFQYYYSDPERVFQVKTRWSGIDINSDVCYKICTTYIARQLSQVLGPDKVFFYSFEMNSELNVLRQKHKEEPDWACHGDELGYLFKIGGMSSSSKEAAKLRCEFLTFWTEFVKTGNPNIEGNDWLPMNVDDKRNDCFMISNDEMGMKWQDEWFNMKFWESIYGTSFCSKRTDEIHIEKEK